MLSPRSAFYLLANAKNFLLSKASATLCAAALMTMGSITTAPEVQANELRGQSLSVAFAVAPPFVVLKNEFRRPEGLDVAIVKELQRRTGFSTQDDAYEVMSFDSIMTLGRVGKTDIVAGAISYTDERANYYDITPPYIYNHTCIVTRGTININSTDDLDGHTVAVENGIDISDLQKQNPTMKTHKVATTFMAFYEVARGMADALVVDEIIAREYIALLPKDAGLKVSAIIPDSKSGMALFFKKNSPHNKALMQAYYDMREDGTLEAIVNRELAHFISAKTSEEMADLRWQHVPVNIVGNQEQ